MVGIWFLWFEEYHISDREISKDCLGVLRGVTYNGAEVESYPVLI